MPATLVELRLNRHFIDNEFEGYKLNLQALPHWKHDLVSGVDKVYPDEAQYSFLHAKLFALHNHLIADYWNHHYTFYYIDKKQQVRRIHFNNDTRSFQNSLVYDVPTNIERKSGHFNLCLMFPTSNLAVISDGAGYLHVVSTEGRSNSDQMWKTLYSTLVLSDNKLFVIIDCRAEEKDDHVTIHCLLQSIEHVEKHFYSILTWVTYENIDNVWKQTSSKQLQGKGIVHHAAIETDFSAVYIASDNQFKFTSDSEKKVTEPPKEEPRKVIYTWLQTMDDITITLKLPCNYDKNLFHVTVSPLAVKVSYAGKDFLDGKLTYKVDSDLTTWNVQESGQVDILVTKVDSVLWNELLEGGNHNGEQIMDASLVEEAHRRLAHLCSETEVTADQAMPGLTSQELEECDAASEEDTNLVRLDATSHEVTHKIPLSVHQYLFNVTIDPNETAALVLRHDVDACVWQPYAKLANTETWPVEHQGTLMAFGYVQSSKQNRKFITCPQDFSYAVVCESSRHIFVYRNCESVNKGSQLRKRTPGGAAKPVTVGHQHVLNIDKYGEVLGINATNNYMFILTENSLVVVEID